MVRSLDVKAEIKRGDDDSLIMIERSGFPYLVVLQRLSVLI